ncbi:MAG: DUF4394 domain-containing protein [Anaerolineae bacterium]|nr:DUF4394 domain-containing protein [Anaerolineae bacterium]
MLSRLVRDFLSHTLVMSFLIIGSGLVPISPAEASGRAADPPPSTGHAPSAAATAATADVGPDSLLSVSSGSAAFAVDVYPNEYMRYIPDTDRPGEWESVGNVAGTAYYAGDFVGRDYSKVYVIDYALNQLHTLNTDTGADTTIGSCNPVSGHVWTGATGTADGTLYASSTAATGTGSYLYTINTMTGAATLVGQITNAPNIIDIAINAAGQMYGLDIDIDSLVRINPVSGAGTVIGSIGYSADYSQGMDFDEESGVLYLAAYNTTSAQGELRIANTTTGSSVLVGAFPNGAETDALAFTPPTTQHLRNPGFESGLAYWYTASAPVLSSTSHSGSQSVLLSGQECWVWQNLHIPADALEVTIGYWISGLSYDPDWDNDIACGGIWDPTWQTKYADACFGLTYFYSSPGVWRHRILRLDAAELASVAGKNVKVAFWITQKDWLSGYHKESWAYVDDTILLVTRPVYDYAVYLPLTIR